MLFKEHFKKLVMVQWLVVILILLIMSVQPTVLGGGENTTIEWIPVGTFWELHIKDPDGIYFMQWWRRDPEGHFWSNETSRIYEWWYYSPGTIDLEWQYTLPNPGFECEMKIWILDGQTPTPQMASLYFRPGISEVEYWSETYPPICHENTNVWTDTWAPQGSHIHILDWNGIKDIWYWTRDIGGDWRGPLSPEWYPAGPVEYAVNCGPLPWNGEVGIWVLDKETPNAEASSWFIGSHGDVHLIYRVKSSTPPPPAPPQYPGGVGGVWVPVDKFGLLAPYIGLTSTIILLTVATAVYVKRVKRRKEKQ